MEKHVKAGPFSILKFVYFNARKSVHSKIAVSGGLLICVCTFFPQSWELVTIEWVWIVEDFDFKKDSR